MKRAALLLLLLIALQFDAPLVRADAEEGHGVDYSTVQRLGPDDGPAMARFVRRCATEQGSLHLALSECPWSLRPAWRTAATEVLLALARDEAADNRASALLPLADVHRWNDAPPSKVVEALIAGITDEVYDVRATAARVIGLLGSEVIRAHGNRLVRLAHGLERLSWEQLQLAQSTAAHGVLESAPLLLWVLRLAPNEYFRREAAISLGELGRRVENRSRTPLLQALRGDKSPGVRAEAARALSVIGRPDDVRAVLQTLAPASGPAHWHADADPGVALKAADVLGWLEDPSPFVRADALEVIASRRPSRPEVVRAMKQALLDPDPDVKTAAWRALLTLETGISREDIERWLNGRSISARMVGTALAEQRPEDDARWAPLLPRTAARLRQDSRIAPLLSFATSRGPAAAYLADALRDMDKPFYSFPYTVSPDEDVKIALAAVLPEGGELEAARRAVRRRFAQGFLSVDWRAALLLARMPRERLLHFRKGLLQLLEQNPWPTAARARLGLAVMALGGAAGAEGKSAVADVLRSQYPINALSALEHVPLRIPDVLELLPALATHPDRAVRTLLATLLRRAARRASTPQRGVVEATLAILRADPDARVRREAAETIPWLE